jgi:hydrocephalus-inducing protein
VNNGVDLEVALKAKGTGSTLYCKENLNFVDFGIEYTHNNITKEFFLENRGRKQMKIQWTRTTKLDRTKKKDPKEEIKNGGVSPKKGANGG